MKIKVSIILLLLMIVTIFGCYDEEKQITVIAAQKRALKRENVKLVDEKKQLMSTNQKLEDEKKQLEDEKRRLEDEKRRLEDEKRRLKKWVSAFNINQEYKLSIAEHEKLLTKYISLKSDCKKLDEEVGALKIKDEEYNRREDVLINALHYYSLGQDQLGWKTYSTLSQVRDISIIKISGIAKAKKVAVSLLGILFLASTCGLMFYHVYKIVIGNPKKEFRKYQYGALGFGLAIYVYLYFLQFSLANLLANHQITSTPWLFYLVHSFVPFIIGILFCTYQVKTKAWKNENNELFFLVVFVLIMSFYFDFIITALNIDLNAKSLFPNMSFSLGYLFFWLSHSFFISDKKSIKKDKGIKK